MPFEIVLYIYILFQVVAHHITIHNRLLLFFSIHFFSVHQNEDAVGRLYRMYDAYVFIDWMRVPLDYYYYYLKVLELIFYATHATLPHANMCVCCISTLFASYARARALVCTNANPI